MAQSPWGPFLLSGESVCTEREALAKVGEEELVLEFSLTGGFLVTFVVCLASPTSVSIVTGAL